MPTPTLDKLAQRGLRYTQMHNTALCSPTRAALLTGRNHHRVGFGMVAEARDRLSRLRLHHRARNRAWRSDAQGERLLHRLVRQEPQRADLGGEPAGPLHAFSDRAGLRLFLRLRRRRHEPVAAGQPVPQHDADPPLRRQAGLEPDQRDGGRRDRVHQHADGDRPEAAVVHPLRAGRDARAASSDARMDREDQRDASLRRRLERGQRTHLREPEEARRHSGERQAAALAGLPAQVGDADGRRRRSSICARSTSGPPTWPTSTTRSDA